MGKKIESKMGTSQATFYVKKTNETSVVCESKKKEKEAETVHDPSLSQMLRCRKNLKPSHKRQKSVLIDSLSNSHVQFRPQEANDLNSSLHTPTRDLFCMQPQGQTSLSGNHEEEELVCVGGKIMTTSQLIRVLDPWISPYSPSDRKKMLEDASTQVKTRSIHNSFRGESSNTFPSSSINHSMYPTPSPQTLSNSPFNYPIQGQPMFQNQPTYWSSPPEMGMQCTPLLGIPVQHYTQMTGPDLDPNFYCAQKLNWVPTEAERFPYLENYQPSFNTTAVPANTYNTFYDASDNYPSNSTQVDLPETEFVFPDGFFIEDQNENVTLQTFNTLYDPNEVPSNFTQVDLPENELFSLDDLFITSDNMALQTCNTLYDPNDKYPLKSMHVNFLENESLFPDDVFNNVRLEFRVFLLSFSLSNQSGIGDFSDEDQNENVALKTCNTLYDPNDKYPLTSMQENLLENESISIDDLLNMFSEDENEIRALDTEGNVDDPLDWDGFHLAESLNSSDLNFILN